MPKLATVLRRCRSSPANTERIDSFGVDRKNSLQPDVVFPAILEVVFVQKAFANPEAKSGQANLARTFVEYRTAM
jgi:hypothetical protein